MDIIRDGFALFQPNQLSNHERKSVCLFSSVGLVTSLALKVLGASKMAVNWTFALSSLAMVGGLSGSVGLVALPVLTTIGFILAAALITPMDTILVVTL